MRRTLAMAAALSLSAVPASAQLKGVWEPVNYPADLELNDVFFVTPEIGWVTGGTGAAGGGVILHTKDGGETWVVQLGDPESSESAYRHLRFVDGTHGFAVQASASGDHHLLRTIDGETWEASGTVPQSRDDYTFTSATVGFAGTREQIVRTTDAGRTWSDVFTCQTRVEVDGLMRDASCSVASFHFPTPEVGYAVGYSSQAPGLFVLRTEDGGETWSAWSVLPAESGKEASVFFTDELSGVACLSSGKFFRTSDGGRTWQGIAGASCSGKPDIRFADPEAGWTLVYRQFNYTADGGKRWSSRELPFPASVAAFSYPRRDRGYAVGEHGMIYRYSVVPAAAAIPAKAIAAPAMPDFETSLDEQVDQFDTIIDELEAAVIEEEAAADSTESSYASECCGKALGRLELLLTAVTATVPQFLGKYENNNLISTGLRMLADLPASVGELRAALQAFRNAPDKTAAQDALARLEGAVRGLNQSAAVALQEEVPVAADDAPESED